ncbi:phosphatidylinositol-3-phosphatase [Nocardioides marmoribigeumensis]
MTKLLVVVVENHSLDQMRRDLPYTFGLAKKYGYATGYTALTHPSEPNYLGIVGGDTFGVTDDGPPSEHVVHGRSVFGQALASGHTARVYAEGMTSSCALTDGGDRYAVKHNPWAYFVDERDACSVDDVSLDQLSPDVEAGHLPDAGLLVPNLCHDAHDADCDLSDADAWMEEQLGLVMSGRDFESGRLAVVVTADEDDHHQDNKVLTAVFHPGLDGKVVSTPLTHYSLTRLYDDVLGVPHLRGAADAPDLAKAFGLDVGPAG